VAAGDARQTIVKDATLLAASAKDTSKHYLRVMEKIVNGTENYIEKEAKRYVRSGRPPWSSCVNLDAIETWSRHYTDDISNDRLASILEKRALSPAKLDEIKIKANILRAFGEEEKAEEVEKTIGKDTAEL
jgi:protein disulfide-isomerase A6